MPAVASILTMMAVLTRLEAQSGRNIAISILRCAKAMQHGLLRRSRQIWQHHLLTPAYHRPPPTSTGPRDRRRLPRRRTMRRGDIGTVRHALPTPASMLARKSRPLGLPVRAKCALLAGHRIEMAHYINVDERAKRDIMMLIFS